MMISNEKATPRAGDFLKPDGWNIGENLKPSDGFSDSSFPGCQFRLPSGQWPFYELAVNVTVTGGKHYHADYGSRSMIKSRCRIEFVGDGEESTFSGGWIFQEVPR